MNHAIIQTEGLRFAYAEEGAVNPFVLDGVSLDIEEGSFVAVLGHNGSGKSTLAKHLNAILLPLIFRFGTQKSRIFFMIAMGVGTAGVVILMGVISATETGIAWLTGAAALLMPVAAAAALMVSYAVSLQIYGKKEL